MDDPSLLTHGLLRARLSPSLSSSYVAALSPTLLVVSTVVLLDVILVRFNGALQVDGVAISSESVALQSIGASRPAPVQR